MLTADQITSNIIDQLRLLDPSASAEVGTPERKIIEATAEMIASSQVDFTVLSSQNDLAVMTGARLDSYLGNFGFGRQQPTASNGIVTFTRSATGNALVIPRGTQLQAVLNNVQFQQLVFITLDTVIMESDSLTVSVTVQCTTAGSIGNISAKAIAGFAGLRSIIGISSVTNTAAMSGGTDGETDSEYKTRFQNTIFRNMAGTFDQFMALAVSATTVTKANIVGPISRYQEYVQIPVADDTAQQTIAGGYDDAGTTWPHKRTTAESTIPYSKFTYPTNHYLTDGTLDPATATFFRKGADYVFNTPPETAGSGSTHVVDSTNSTLPNVTILATSDHGGSPLLVPGNVILLEHAYLSRNSRNDYSLGILNCVDVFVNGRNDLSVSSIEVVPPSSNNLQNTNTASWTYQKTTVTKVINFRRYIDGSNATVGSRVQPLFWQPVSDLPDSIIIGTNTFFKANYFKVADSTYYNKFDGTTYTQKAHYAFVQEVNSAYGTIRGRSGIEWFLAGNNYLNGALTSDNLVTSTYNGVKIDTLAGTQFTLTNYLYDQNISDLQAVMEKNKQVATDVLVHRAKTRYFRPIVTIMYTLGATQSVVNASIIATLENFFANQYFGAAIQLSDILQTVHNTTGVDNVRWTNDTGGGNKVEEVNLDGSSFSTPTFFTTDFFLQDNELVDSPNTNQVTITVRAANTWGS